MSTPISSITSCTKLSALPERTPAGADQSRPGKYLRASAAAIGRAHRVHRADEQHGGQVLLALIDPARKGLHRADQREQPPRRVEVHLELVVEAGSSAVRRVVVEAAPGHVDGLDL